MNNIYKVIFNRNSQQFVVVSELTKSSGKSSTAPKAKIDDLFSLLFENLFGNKEPINPPIVLVSDECQCLSVTSG